MLGGHRIFFVAVAVLIVGAFVALSRDVPRRGVDLRTQRQGATYDRIPPPKSVEGAAVEDVGRRTAPKEPGVPRAQLSFVERHGEALREAAADRSSDFAIMVGRATRETYPGDYDEAIRRIALGHALNVVDQGIEGRAAHFCGFMSSEELETFLASDDPDAIRVRPQLLALHGEALEVAAELSAVWAEAWARPDSLEIVDPSDEQYSSENWVSSNGHDAPAGLLQMGLSVPAGDRTFRLHFDSYRFPALEARLMALEAMKENLSRSR